MRPRPLAALLLVLAFALTWVAPGTAGAGGPRYQVTVDAPSAAVGATAQLIVRVTPAKGAKINVEYPSKLSLTPGEGVHIAKAKLTAADGTITAAGITFKIPVTVARAGAYQLTGVLKFATCTEDTCDIERVDLVASGVAQ